MKIWVWMPLSPLKPPSGEPVAQSLWGYTHCFSPPQPRNKPKRERRRCRQNFLVTVGSQGPAAVHCCWLDVLANFRYARALTHSEASRPTAAGRAGPLPRGPLSCGTWGVGLERDALSKLTLSTSAGELRGGAMRV